MGAGASKSPNVAQKGMIDEELEDAALDREFEDALEKRRKQMAAAAPKKKKKSGIGFFQGSKKTEDKSKIVGLNESDDDGDALKSDKDEIEEIDGLNRTFASIGLDESGSSRHSHLQRTRQNRIPSLSQASTTATAPSTSHGFQENSFLNQSITPHTRFQGTSVGRRPSQQLQPQQRSGKSLKFSWDDQLQPPPVHEDKGGENWTYQSVIDGFDPDKFRKVNKLTNSSSVSTLSHAPSASTGPRFPSTAQIDVPGTVPTYDRTEQQLIASLEHELGVV